MANTTRLEAGVELRKGVMAGGGTDADIELVLAEAPDFFEELGKEVINRASIIRGDKECFRLTDLDLVIPMPALKRPTLDDVQKAWSYVKRIERDDSSEEAVTFRLATVLKSDETQIDGSTYEQRLTQRRNKGELLGFQHRQWLIKNQNNEEAIPDPKARAALKALLGKVYIDFPAIIAVDDGDFRDFPAAAQLGKRWDESWDWISDGLRSSGRIAVSGK